MQVKGVPAFQAERIAVDCADVPDPFFVERVRGKRPPRHPDGHWKAQIRLDIAAQQRISILRADLMIVIECGPDIL